MDALLIAIELLKTQAALAEKINEWHTKAGRESKVSQQNISYWIKSGHIPETHCIGIAWATHWKVTPHELRADIYPHFEDGLPEERRTKPRYAA